MQDCHMLRQLVLGAVEVVLQLVLGESPAFLVPVPRLRRHTLPKELVYDLGRQRSAGAYTLQRTSCCRRATFMVELLLAGLHRAGPQSKAAAPRPADKDAAR